jgi:hypothetical protein
MASTQTCPVCNGPINPGDHECKRCGFRLAGKTEMFNPVGTGNTGVNAPVPATAPQRFSLYVSKGPQTGENFYLDSPHITLGRDPQSDIFLNDMTVSRCHASITIDGDKLTVHDDGSLNGTWIDGEIVEDAELKPGSVLQIGTFKMVLQEHDVV